MDQGDGAEPFAGAEHRDRHPVVAADADEQGAGVEDLLRRRFRLAVVGVEVAGVSGDVAAVDHPDVPSVEQRPAEVEVEPVEVLRDPRRRDPHRGGRVGLVVRHLVDGVGIAVRQPEDRDVRVEGVEVGVKGEVEERRVRGPGRDGELLGHRKPPAWSERTLPCRRTFIPVKGGLPLETRALESGRRARWRVTGIYRISIGLRQAGARASASPGVRMGGRQARDIRDHGRRHSTSLRSLSNPWDPPLSFSLVDRLPRGYRRTAPTRRPSEGANPREDSHTARCSGGRFRQLRLRPKPVTGIPNPP